MVEERIRQYTLVGAITLVAACVFVGTVVRATFYAPDPEFQLPLEEPTYVEGAVGLPERLIIPTIDIDASVERVGINAKGNMAAPSNYSDVGWYKYGTRPGEKGSAVVAGHLNNGLGLDGVFTDLSELEKGDEIIIETTRGELLHFEVVKVASYDHEEVPTDVLFNQDDTARLNLITCEGKWVRDEKTYDERLVVYTVLREVDQI